MAFALDEEPTQIEDAFFEGLTAAKEEYVASLAQDVRIGTVALRNGPFLL